MSLLEVRDLKVYFRNDKTIAKAVDGVSFDINENEIVGLVGESGSGKTITGYAIMGILPRGAKVEEGSIEFEARNILGLSNKEMLDIRGKKIAVVFQEPFASLNPVLRVGYQIEEMTRNKIDSLRLLEKVRIKNPERVFYAYPHQLSGGQRQRVMIAMAIALNPKLLIADEPTTALDVTIQSEILKLLHDLKKDLNLAILFITHDFGIINEMADRILVMKEGRIVESASKRDILSTPKHEYTKRLIEAVPKMVHGPSLDFAPLASLGTSRDRQPIAKRSKVFIEARNLNKSFPVERGVFKREIARVEAVKNVSMKIEKGKTLGLVGESGCGKSTLGRLFLGLEKPDSGKILIQEESYKLYPQSIRKMLQIVFQDPYSSLDPRMHMGAIVLEGPGLLGIGKKEKELLLKDILYRVHLSYSDRFKYPHQFSGGQRQRIAIARALAVKPKFIVLDEPVSSLDVLIQQDILNLLKDLKTEMKLTYLFISHDLRVIELMSDDVCVMQNGEIVEIAPKDEIYTNPKHPYTKCLLESIPCLPRA